MATAADDEPLPKLTKAQIRKILHNPAHLHIKHLAYACTGAGISGSIIAFLTIATVSYWGWRVLLAQKWEGYLLILAAMLCILWSVFTVLYQHDIRTLQYPDLLAIDISRMMVSCVTTIVLLAYICHKNIQSPAQATFNLSCDAGCDWKFKVFQYAPGFVAFLLFILAIAQLTLAILLYRDPIVNPPPGEDPDASSLPPKPKKTNTSSSKSAQSDTDSEAEHPSPPPPYATEGLTKEMSEAYDPPIPVAGPGPQTEAQRELGRSKRNRSRSRSRSRAKEGKRRSGGYEQV